MYLSPLQVLLGEADLAAFRWGLTSLCCRSYCWFASIAEENWLRVYGAEYLQGSLLTFPNQRVQQSCQVQTQKEDQAMGKDIHRRCEGGLFESGGLV